jgi:hypothetical protein
MLLIVSVAKLLIDDVLMAATCAVDITAICAVVNPAISVEVVAAIVAVLNAEICVVV